jgi:hypothetical protein
MAKVQEDCLAFDTSTGTYPLGWEGTNTEGPDFRFVRCFRPGIGSEPVLGEMAVAAHVGERGDGLVMAQVSSPLLESPLTLSRLCFILR